MTQTLFRAEALRQQGERLWGDLLLSQPLSHGMFTLFLATLTAFALGFLAQHDYVRKQSVAGMLVPDRGLLEIRAPATGRIRMLDVRADQQVLAGTPLFTLQIDHTDNGIAGVTGQLLRQVAAQQQALEHQRLAVQEQAQAAREQFAVRKSLLRDQRAVLGARLATATALLELRQQGLVRASTLRQRGLLAAADLDSAQAQVLQQQTVLQELDLQRLQLESAQADLDAEQQAATLVARRDLEQLESDLAELRKQQLRLGSEQGTTVLAPVDGRITGVLHQGGMSVSAQEPVLMLMPAGAQLEAELLLPSSAIGFIAVGQPVKVRYDAFPYQKFGVHEASVRSMTESAVGSAPARVAGSDGISANGGQPMFRVLATLQAQHISAYGQTRPLRPGMVLSADIVLDRRSLLEWLLEPLFSIRGTRE